MRNGAAPRQSEEIAHRVCAIAHVHVRAKPHYSYRLAHRSPASELRWRYHRSSQDASLQHSSLRQQEEHFDRPCHQRRRATSRLPIQQRHRPRSPLRPKSTGHAHRISKNRASSTCGPSARVARRRARPSLLRPSGEAHQQAQRSSTKQGRQSLTSTGRQASA